MTRSSILIELNRSGIKALLASSEVQAMLEGKAAAVVNAAKGRGILVGGDPGDTPLPVEAISEASGARAKAMVSINHPAGIAVEAKHRLLVGSLDAARS